MKFKIWLEHKLERQPLWYLVLTALATIALGIVAMFALARCNPPPEMDVVTVAVQDCIQPQLGWIRDGVGNLRWVGVFFQPVGLGDSPDVTVVCGDLSGSNPAAGAYTLGQNSVTVDPVYAPGEFGITAAANHELFHWYVNHRGAYPDRAKYHVCRFAGEVPLCWPGGYESGDLMNPSLGAGTPFSADTESVDVGDIPQNSPQGGDQAFFQWATGRSL